MSTTHTTTTPAVTARGTNGQITVEDDRIMVRKGLLTRRSGLRGERFLSPSAIAAVRLQPATDQRAGHLELVLHGEDPDDPDRPGAGELTITFAPASAPSFEQVRARLAALL